MNGQLAKQTPQAGKNAKEWALPEPAQIVQEKAREQAEAFMEFLRHSHTSFHASAQVAERLEAAGFSQLNPAAEWPAGGKHFIRQGGAVIAWDLPADQSSDQLEGKDFPSRGAFQIVGAHTDSPALRVKPQPDFTAHGWGQFGVEIYGGTLWNSWLDRDLVVAGRLLDYSGVEHLVQSGPIARINQLAPHLDRSVNPDGVKVNPQDHLQPLWYVTALHEEQPSLVAYLAKSAGLEEKDVAGFDLFALDGQDPALLGAGQELLSASRLDNLSSSFPALLAFIDATQADASERKNGSERTVNVPVLALFDHEEIGSATTTGAAGPLLEHTLQRLSFAAGTNLAGHLRVLGRSEMISADAGHLVNPNQAEKHDPRVQPEPGKGPLLKINANQRYATSGEGEALFARACAAAGVPYQSFVSNNAVSCGSTIGPISATRLGVDVVDVGVGLLAMHSVRELCCTTDLYYLRRALAAFYQGA